MPSDDTIGTGGDFSTIALWEDSVSALSGVHRGRMLNQSFSEQVIISGQTGASPTDYMELTADTGASFADDDSLPLRFNDSNFARIDMLGPAYQPLVDIETPYTRFNRVQVMQQHNVRQCVVVDASATGAIVSQLVVESGIDSIVANSVHNCLSITRSNLSHGIKMNTSGSCEFCTAIFRIGMFASTAGVRMQYGVGRLQNNTSFGFQSGFSVAAVDASSSTNATDENTQVTGTDLINQTYSETTPFVKSTTDGTEDYKLAVGSPLEGAGQPSANGINIDIYGNPRDPTNPSIGCFEPQAAQPVTGPDAVFHGFNF